MRRGIRKSSAADDRLNAVALACVLMACAGSGVAIAQLVERGSRAQLEPAHARRDATPARETQTASATAPREIAATRTQPAAAKTPPVVVPEPSTVAPTAITHGRTPDAPRQAVAAPAAAPSAPAMRARTLLPGMVAYVRCDGAERAGARFPCPRDRAFEERVWSALRKLEHCEVGDPGRGQLEARIETQEGAPGAVTLRPAKRASGLDLRAVSKCAEQDLGAIRSALPARHLIAAFRFELR